jgi:hypothetical protein
MEPLHLKGTNKDDHWQSQTDARNIRTSSCDRHSVKLPEEKPEWILAPLPHQLFQTTAFQEQLEELVMQATQEHQKPSRTGGQDQDADHSQPGRMRKRDGHF